MNAQQTTINPIQTPRPRTRRTKWATGGGALVALGLAATAAHAVFVGIGGTVATPGTSAAARPVLTGPFIYSNVVPFSAAGPGGTVLKGKVFDRIIKEAAGNLTFYHQIILDSATNVIVYGEDWERFSNPTATYFSDVDWRTDAGGVARPTHASRVSTPLVRFFFPRSKTPNTPVVLTGNETSRYHFVRTNAPTFDKEGKTILYAYSSATGAGITVSLPTVEPTGKALHIQ